jgi:type IV secretion system protein VirB10
MAEKPLDPDEDENDIPRPSMDDLPPEDFQESYAEEDYAAEMPPENGKTQFKETRPAVAATQGKTLLIAGVGVALFAFFFYQLFIAGDDAPPSEKPEEKQAVTVAAPDTIPVIVTEPPPPPPPPSEPVQALPPLPPPPVMTPPEPTVAITAEDPNNQAMMARRKSNMLLAQGTGKPLTDAGDSNPLAGRYAASFNGIVPGSADDKFKSGAARAVATHVGDLRKLILQGKIVQAVLETAIDSTFPGPLRAIVGRDVYAEAGSTVLIPKGSRLIGTYNADIVRGNARIFIVWNRLIRPDGVDIEIASPAVDRLGRIGLTGFVDNRYFEIFTGSVLTSAFTIGMAVAATKMTNAGEVTATQNTDGSTTQTGDPISMATLDAVTNMGDTAQRVLGGLLDMRPLITVDQGTVVNVFVNRDLEFPDEVTSRVKLVR